MQNSVKVRPDMDIWVVPRFAQDVLGVDPAQVQKDLESNYPVVGKGDAIEPMKAQWVDGSNKALNYRGNDLKRCKMWFQRGNPESNGYVKYYYTGDRFFAITPSVHPTPRRCYCFLRCPASPPLKVGACACAIE